MSKPWQIILIIAAIAVLAFSGWRMMNRNSIDSPNGHMTVDVITGQLYLVQKGKAKGIMYPAKHPDTGDRTLYPVNEIDDSGQWELHARTGDSIPRDIRERSSALGSGLKIKILDEKPIVYVIKK